MKKIFLFLFLFISTTAFAEKKVSGGYSIPCETCKEITLGGKKIGCSYCLGCPMWRRFDLEIKHKVYKFDKEKKEYVNTEVSGINGMVYRCQHGHQIIVQ